jgi:ABC-2 type transport system ATP-binding protein
MVVVEQLTKLYGPSRGIDQVSFTVEKGEIVGLLGPNGAGKSTTMRILAGALGATSGSARIGGVDVFEDPRRVKELTGYLPERPPLYTDMTVEAYLTFCARIKGVAKVGEAVDRAVGRVGLVAVRHRLIEHLSKGFRQRVGIAQAIVHDPAVLILDEPASGLDPAQRVEIRKLVRELAEGDTTVILSTHVLPEVEATCGRVVIIDRGVIRKVGTVAELAATTSVEVTVARPDRALLAGLEAIDGVTGVVDHGHGRIVVVSEGDQREAIARVAVEAGLLAMAPTDGLEDAFLRLTGGEA